MKSARLFSSFCIIISVFIISSCIKTERNNPFDQKSPNNPYYNYPIMMDKISHDFGYISPGSTSGPVDIYVYNKTNGPVFIQEVASTNPDYFVISAIQDFTPPSYLNGNGNFHFQVEFMPDNQQPYDGSIEVVYQEPGGPKISMHVTGTGGGGGGTGTVWVDPASYPFGTVQISTSVQHTFTIRNDTGQQAYLTYIESTDSGNFEVDYTSFNYTAPISSYGGTKTFSVIFHPQNSTYLSANINISYTNGQGTFPLTASVNGTGSTTPPTAGNYQVYVSAYSGNDSYSGSSTQPKATIQAAVNAANPGDKIAVAAGYYYVNDSTPIVLEGEQLFGGFPDDTTWSNRDPRTNISYIYDNQANSGSWYDDYSASPASVIVINGNTSYDTVVDGFLINAKTSGVCTSGIFVNADYYSSGFNAVIRNNKIYGGSASSSSESPQSFGIFFNNYYASSQTYTIEISANEIYGGDSYSNYSGIFSKSHGIMLYNPGGDYITANIWNNTIDGGYSSAYSGTDVSYTYGVRCWNTSPRILNNTINGGYEVGGGVDSSSYGIYLQDYSYPSIINNIIFTSYGYFEYGIYEADSTSYPTYVDYNNVYNCYVLYSDYYNGDMTEINSGSFYNPITYYYSSPAGSNNFITDPIFDLYSYDGLHLSTSSPIKNSGINVTTNYGYSFQINDQSYPIDKDGNQRTDYNGWSIGAYEQDY